MNFPIGFLDSGIGGASILKPLTNKIKNESFVYFTDVLNAPYGKKSKKKVERCVIDAVKFLVEKRAIKMLVVACNTASSAAKELISKTFPNLVCVYVEPPIKVAVDNNKKNILVLATKRTLKNNKTLKFYTKLCKKNNIKAKKLFVKNLASLIDNNFEDKNLIKQTLNKKIKNKNFDAVVLGCTHYNFVKKEIKDCFKNAEIISCEKGVVKRILSLYDFYKMQGEKFNIEIILNGENNLVKSRLVKMFPGANSTQKY
ncbi:MAG: glutamate racemase [Clostridia bacterium]|nr:glutamate racemase [Clostridia bacterium]